LHTSQPSGPQKEPAAKAADTSTKRTDADTDTRMSPVPSNSGSHREPSGDAGSDPSKLFDDDGDIRMSPIPSRSGSHREPSIPPINRAASSMPAKCEFQSSHHQSEIH
jgi:hypothetical protein